MTLSPLLLTLLLSLLAHLIIALLLLRRRFLEIERSASVKQAQELLEKELAFEQRRGQEQNQEFELLCHKILEHQQEHFLKIASSSLEQQLTLFKERQEKLLSGQEQKMDHLVTPVKERLQEMDRKQHELNDRWIQTHSALKESLVHQGDAVSSLREQTQKLTRTLYSSQDRGAWGEVQLERIIEICGLTAYCDYRLQTSFKNRQGETLRPDALIQLPQGRQVCIDAKTPFQQDPRSISDQKIHEEQVAQTLKKQIQLLASKEYHQALPQSPDFMILFVPMESTLHHALRAQPELVEYGAKKGIVLASPASLIAILKCIHLSWKQVSLQENVQKALSFSEELFHRLEKLSHLFDQLGRSIEKSAQNFDQLEASYQKRVLVSAKKLANLTKDETGNEEEHPKLPPSTT